MDPHSDAEQGGQPADNVDALASLRHDIRQCLYVLRTGFELLKQSRDDQGQFEEICGMMETEERKASHLIEEMLSVARHESK